MAAKTIYRVELAGDEPGNVLEVVMEHDVVGVRISLGNQTLVGCLPIEEARRLALALVTELGGIFLEGR